MIYLTKERYCEDCPYFDAVTKSAFYEDGTVVTAVYCANNKKCRQAVAAFKKLMEEQRGKEK